MARQKLVLYKQQIHAVSATFNANMAHLLYLLTECSNRIATAANMKELTVLTEAIEEQQALIKKHRVQYQNNIKRIVKHVKEANHQQVPISCQTLVQQKQETLQAWHLIEKDIKKHILSEIKLWHKNGPRPISHEQATHWLKEAKMQVADGLKKMVKPLQAEATVLADGLKKEMVTHFQKPLGLEADEMAKRLSDKWQQAKSKRNTP